MTKNSQKSKKFIPWNKGKRVGQKKPFSRSQVRTIKNILAEKGNLRDLALFATAIDTMLRESDVLALRVDDVCDVKEEMRSQIDVKQKKTGKGHTVELSPNTQEILRQWIREAGKFDDDYLFTGIKKGRKDKPISLRYFRNLVKQWAEFAHLDPREHSTHSLRRSKAVHVYKKTNNPEVVRQLLGQSSIQNTSAYLNISKQEALKIARENEF